MKTCKEGCGGKMKNGGKVATIKKMKLGGAKPCGPMLCPDGNGSCINCPSGKKAGVIITAIVSGMANALGGKKRQANEAAKKAAEEAANTPVAKFTKKLDETLKTKKMGGVTKKKYARGGTTGGYAPAQKGGDNTKNGIYGMSQQNMGTSSQYTPVAKKGGAVKKAKLAAMAPPKGKITRADIITAAKRNAKKKK